MEKDASYGIVFVVAAVVLMLFGLGSMRCEMNITSKPLTIAPADGGASD